MGRKIPIDFNDDKLLNVNAYITSPHIQNPGTCLFYVDTGSPYTIITENKARELGIDVDSLKNHPRGISGFGEGVTQARELELVCLIMMDMDGKTYPVELEKILITMKARDKEKRKKKRLINILNVVGADFFQKSELTLKVNISQTIAYMEDIKL